MFKRLARWILRDELHEREAETEFRMHDWNEGHAEGEDEGWKRGFEDGKVSGMNESWEHIAEAVESLLKSGTMRLLPGRGVDDEPTCFVRPREPFHVIAAEVQLSDAPALDDPNLTLLETDPDWCERMGITATQIQATLHPEEWARCRAIDRLLPKLARLIDAKLTGREVVPGRMRYLVAVSVQEAKES